MALLSRRWRWLSGWPGVGPGSAQIRTPERAASRLSVFRASARSGDECVALAWAPCPTKSVGDAGNAPALPVALLRPPRGQSEGSCQWRVVHLDATVKSCALPAR